MVVFKALHIPSKPITEEQRKEQDSSNPVSAP
jgi:hypothetical protein